LSALIAAGCLCLGVAHAETLQRGGTDNAARFEKSGKPSRGMTQSGVETKFGSPNAKKAAVGDPPISRWEYGDFVVFFEYDKVIHAVSTR
jgi:hypothetical protein